MIDKKMHGINGFKVIQIDFQKEEWEGVDWVNWLRLWTGGTFRKGGNDLRFP
jgi:hypothetical protein